MVESISVNKNRITEAVLKRKNGLNFFRFYPSVTADIEKALAAGEISIID